MNVTKTVIGATLAGVLGASVVAAYRSYSVQQQEESINHSYQNQSQNSSQDLFELAMQRASENPLLARDYLIRAGQLGIKHGYAPEIFMESGVRETLQAFKDVMLEKQASGLSESRKIAADFIDVFSRTRFYTDYLKTHEEATEDTARKMQGAQAVQMTSSQFENFRSNIRRRILRR